MGRRVERGLLTLTLSYREGSLRVAATRPFLMEPGGAASLPSDGFAALGGEWRSGATRG